jgi:D-alanyl-D-alanine dipeptidase
MRVRVIAGIGLANAARVKQAAAQGGYATLDNRHSGMVRKDQTRNLEIPGSMLRIAPE